MCRLNASHEPTPAERALGEAAISAVAAPLAYARADMVSTAAGPRLMELELIEPQLFLDFDVAAPGRFADVLVAVLESGVVV